MGIFDSFRNSIRGKVGEFKVNSKLNPQIFGKVNHRQINNLVLIDELGKTHQIDHVEIRENGIFCIETKNYSGWIFGNSYSDKWTQVIYNEKHYFLNPLKQNKSHIYHLNKVLGKKYKINSVVVMVQNNANRIDADNVINLVNLKSYLKNYNDGTMLSIKTMDEIYHKLLEANHKTSNKAHVESINKTKIELDNNICPRCGGNLVKRQGKYGNFFGCSNYPNCKFIKKI